MDSTVFAIIVFSVYFVLWFFDSFFKSCMHYPYEAFLNGTGITVRPFCIQWYTTAFNRATIKWAHAYPKLLTFSFDIGVFASILLLPLILIWQIHPYISGVISKESKVPNFKHNSQNTMQFELLLPGVNLPSNEISYYVIAMGICSLVHETGHALAAVLEDVPLSGFGFNVLLIMPVAYTHLSSEQLNSLRTWRRLRIFCAGIWHNLLLAVYCFLTMISLPFLLTPFYYIDNAIVVKSIHHDSPLAGENGIFTGDVIESINGCRIKNIKTWYDCLANTIKDPPAYCIPSDYVLEHDESVPVTHTNNGFVECCDRNDGKSVCFEYVNEEGSYSLVELPQFMCLNIRNTIDNSRAYCHQTSGKCEASFCIKPIMNNSTTLIRIERTNKRDVMYLGHPADLANTIAVSAFVPNSFLFSANFADGISLLLKYLVVFSLGLAILNIIPCFYFDGYHITKVSINHLLHEIVPERHRRDYITMTITSIGTFSLIVILIKSLWYSIFMNKFTMPQYKSPQ